MPTETIIALEPVRAISDRWQLPVQPVILRKSVHDVEVDHEGVHKITVDCGLILAVSNPTLQLKQLLEICRVKRSQFEQSCVHRHILTTIVN